MVEIILLSGLPPEQRLAWLRKTHDSRACNERQPSKNKTDVPLTLRRSADVGNQGLGSIMVVKDRKRKINEDLGCRDARSGSGREGRW